MQTVAGTRQIVMLYDGVIRNLHLAREAMREKRYEDRYHLLTRAGEIVFGLQSCLDFERGGQMANVLYNFYSTLDVRIFALHRTNDVTSCDQLIQEIKQMRDVWDEIDRSQSGEGASAQQAPVSEQPPAPAGNSSQAEMAAVEAAVAGGLSFSA